MRSVVIFLLGLLVVAALGCGGSSSSVPMTPTSTPASQTPPAISLATVVSGLTNPVGLETLPDGRLFVLEQAGRIRIIQNGSLVAQPFLDITSRIESGGEKGLLGLAFHPAYAQNGCFFVNYTRRVSGHLQTIISEFTASASDPNAADDASERMLIVLDQPFDNHNGGQLSFGPDGFLYIGLGDGGSEGDPLGNGQNLQTMLGKILRIDVNASDMGRNYHIPADNPFAIGGGVPEIWAFGLRNPWRFSFDGTGRLFAGDVGQDTREEIDIIVRGGNYGWNIMEGSICFNPPSNCNQSGLTLPIFDYGHGSDGTVVTGGFVYGGTGVQGLQGFYIFGDFGSGKIWALRQDSSGTWTRFNLLSTGRAISSFGRDSSNELYVVDYSGEILRIAPG